MEVTKLGRSSGAQLAIGLIATFVLPIASASPAAPPAARPRVAVLRLELPASVIVPWLNDRVETSLLHDTMIDALVHSQALDVVERTRVDALLTEAELTGPLPESSSAARLAKALGATHLAISTLADVDVSEDTAPLPYTSRVQRILRGRLRIDFRVVEADSSRVAFSGTVDARDQMSGLADDEAADEVKALGERLERHAAEEFARQVVEGLVPLKVVSVKGEEVDLSRGTASGVREGFSCDVVDSAGEAIARVTVTHAAEVSATGQLTGEAHAVRPDMRCRSLRAVLAPPAIAGRRDPLEGRW